MDKVICPANFRPVFGGVLGWRRGRIPVLEAVAARARAAYASSGCVDVTAAGIVAQAQRPAALAEYRVELERASFRRVFTPDRWLSHSVEADLLNTATTWRSSERAGRAWLSGAGAGNRPLPKRSEVVYVPLAPGALPPMRGHSV